MIRNASGDPIERGMVVDRLDHFKVSGRVLSTNTRHHPHTPVLVRWPGLDDEWCSAELLYPQPMDSETTAAGTLTPGRPEHIVLERAIEIFETRTGLEYGDEHVHSHDWADARARAAEEASTLA